MLKAKSISRYERERIGIRGSNLESVCLSEYRWMNHPYLSNYEKERSLEA